MAQIWIALPVPGGRALPDVGSWEGIPIKGKHPRRENQLLKSRSSTQAIFSRLNHIAEMWSKVIEYFQEKSEMNGVNYWCAKTLAILCYKGWCQIHYDFMGLYSFYVFCVFFVVLRDPTWKSPIWVIFSQLRCDRTNQLPLEWWKQEVVVNLHK